MDLRKRDPKTARSKFERWILEQGGTAEVGKLLGVHQATVVKWISKHARPSLLVAKKLTEVSNGQLSWDDIIEGTVPW